MSQSNQSARRTGPIVCIGEALIDLIGPDTSNWSEIDHLTPRIGGAPANTAVAISRLGGQSAFLGCRASDPQGQWIADRLTREGVDVTNLRIVEKTQTRLALVTGPADSRTFSFYGSPVADTRLSPEHVDAAGIELASAVIVSSLLLTEEPSCSAMHKVLETCGTREIPIVFDPNPRPGIWPDPVAARSAMLPFIRNASVLKMGAEEPDFLGLSVSEIREHQPEDAVFVLTDGPRGCWYWYGDDEPVHVVPVPVDAVDSTGAGDAFTAGLTLRFVEAGQRISKSDVEFASVVGALTTTRQGAMDALPDRQTVESVLAGR